MQFSDHKKQMTIVYSCLFICFCLVYICDVNGEACYKAHCSVLQVDGECRIVTQQECNKTNRNIVTWNMKNFTLDSCLSSSDCCDANNTTYGQNLCVYIDPNCQSMDTVNYLIEHNWSGEVTTQITSSIVTCLSHTSNTSSATSTSSMAMCPASNLSFQNQCCLYYFLICLCEGEQEKTETRFPTSIPATSDASSLVTLDEPTTSSYSHSNFDEILRLLKVLNFDCDAKKGECSRGIANVVIAIEIQLKKLAQDLLHWNYSSVTNNDFEMAALHVDCVSMHCDANVTFRNNDVKIRVNRNNASMFVAAATIVIRSAILRNLIPNPRSGVHGNVSYVIAADGIPCVSVAGYSGTDGWPAHAAVNFTWNGSYALALTNQLLPLVRDTADHVMMTSIEPRCGYIDTRSEAISSIGCKVRESNSNIECECNHTTVFSILLAVNARVVPFGVKICSYVTEALSVNFLILTIFMLLRYKERIKSDRTMIQIHLCVSLLFLHIHLLLSDAIRSYDAWCAATAVATHFFLLSTAMWMSVEGIRLYLLTSHHVLRYGTSNMKKRVVLNLLVGWGTPFFLTCMFVAVGWTLGTYVKESYLYNFQHKRNLATDLPKYEYCWLDSNQPVYFAFVTAPVSLALLFNLGIALKVFWQIVRMNHFSNELRSTSHSNSQNLKSTFKALLILVTTLGLPWAIGFLAGLTSLHASVVMMYLNAIVNGLQGVFVFILYCLHNPYIGNKIDTSTSHISFFKNTPKSY